MQLLKALWALAGAAICCFLIFVIHSQFLKEGQLAAGTCEIVTLDRDSSQPRRTIARQTARCACKKGQIAGTTRARPACVDARIIKTKQWCEMLPCLEGEGCDLLINKSGWTCTQPGGRIKTTTSNLLLVEKEELGAIRESEQRLWISWPLQAIQRIRFTHIILQ
ncbi:chemokine-like protein TAFA-5 isoform X7 [Corvus cornix cornix]|uniref:protein FAM19A5 isoform X8 n=1 Tax=Corvus brachyrhynchos TaxID=85066 RepID=UPI00081641D2|nr:PREDICTED: protein FAM19A5 isoform X8 [Corvus brachyrhynchos]XP_019139178.1 chemokine-like protein TAFA-5 isoform X7 [Corvus cornix cornix]XP_031962352.1 chemokine-like protein TAFA-5 isoform X7 [Corvus moneduloides]XP_041874199.1 chemokine-like protein TAFA-5 isoform X5 [Corvus kubaryi]